MTGAISLGLRDAICFRNCTHSSLTLTRSVAPRDLHLWLPRRTSQKRNIFEQKTQKMLVICQIDWREVGVAVKLQCLRNCTLSSLFIKHLDLDVNII